MSTLGACQGSCFYAGNGPAFVFIDNNDVPKADIIEHEVGHAFMYNLTGYWYVDLFCLNHNLFSQEDQQCAYTEGWGDFFAVAVNGGDCFDYDTGSCTGSYYNIEAPNLLDQYSNPPNAYKDYPFGDAVEGRVAGALLDLMDTNNDPPYDNSSAGFAPLTSTLMQTSYDYGTFWWFVYFFESSAGQNKHNSVRSVYQNTIDYDYPPTISSTTVGILQNIPGIHIVNLWNISDDLESTDSELDFQVQNISDTRCNVVLDANRWLNATSQTGWLGSCDVTIRVSDSIKLSTGIVHIDVYPVADRNYLPTVINQP